MLAGTRPKRRQADHSRLLCALVRLPRRVAARRCWLCAGCASAGFIAARMRLVRPVLAVHLVPRTEISTGAAREKHAVLLGSWQSANRSRPTATTPDHGVSAALERLPMPLLFVSRLSRPAQLHTGSGTPVLAGLGRPILGLPRPGAMQPPPDPCALGRRGSSRAPFVLSRAAPSNSQQGPPLAVLPMVDTPPCP